MNSSLEYWQKRWAEQGPATERDSLSWPDKYARHLELLYISKHVPEDGTIIEIGCGQGHALQGLSSEFGAGVCCDSCNRRLQKRYVGLEGSEVAIIEAQKRYPGFNFRCADLTKDPIPAGDFILSKRFLQNLAPEARGPVFEQVFKFKHGLLIEDVGYYRERTNSLREIMHRERLEVPAFNWPLTLGVLQGPLMEHTGFYDPFMGYFYSITRVYPDLPKAGFEAAYELSRRAIEKDQWQPPCGPVVAVRW